MESLDLDVDSPDKVLEILVHAVENFYDSASELDSAWQDRNAGMPWEIIAQELEKAISKIEHRFKRGG